MKRLTALTLVLSLALNSRVSASSTKTIFAATASGTNGAIETLEVSPGLGLNVNLIPTGEVVTQAWLDDPSQVGLSSNGKLCAWLPREQKQECTYGSGAKVIHLRRIKPINFPALTRSPNGVTLLTLVTEGANGTSLYQFRVVPVPNEQQPTYTTITIVPNPERLERVVEPSPRATNNQQWRLQTDIPASNTAAFTRKPQTSSPTTATVSTAVPNLVHLGKKS